MSVNAPMIDGLLRRTWGFKGFVVTDCWALSDVAWRHTWRPEGWSGENWGEKETAAYSMLAGVDLNCGSILAPFAGEAVKAGLLSENDIDKALVRLFTARISTGEFDPDGGVFGGERFVGEIKSDEHRELAEKMSDNAVVLLENSGILPLKKDIKKLVLIGGCADKLILGDYSTDAPQYTSTPLEGIRAALERANPKAELVFIPGSLSNSGQYLMNTKNILLLDSDGKRLSKIDFSQNAEMKNCRIEDAGNIGYASSNGCWIKFNSGAIDFSGCVKFLVEMAGDNNVPLTRLEIRAASPDNGPLLGTVDGVGSTGGWGNYKTYTFDAALGGGYTDQDIYLVMSKVPVQTDYTEKEKEDIRTADAVVYFAGTRPGENGYFEETDGYTLELPNNQSEMIGKAAGLNDNVIVYIQAVSQVDISAFKKKAKAILWSTYNGQAQGNAAGRILFGEVNPSAKLPFTWYKSIYDLADVTDYTIRPNDLNKGRTYQYFTGSIDYPFGYGLSYTDFEYSNLKIDKTEVTPDDDITVTFDVTNTGSVDGYEVAQLYIVSDKAEENERPVKRLKGFEKRLIKSGETVSFSIIAKAEDLWFWDSKNNVQTYDDGRYIIEVGGNSKSCEELTAEFNLCGRLTKKLYAVTAIPNGHIMRLSDDKAIHIDLSASYNDQSMIKLKSSMVKYYSTNPDVATVDGDGKVYPVSEGIASVIVSVTVDGETKTDSFAVRVLG